MSITTGNSSIRPDHSNLPVHKEDAKSPIPIPKPPETSDDVSIDENPPVCPTSARNVALGLVVVPQKEPSVEKAGISEVVNHGKVIDSDGKPIVISEVMEKAVIGLKMASVAEKGIGIGLQHANLMVTKESIPCGLQLISQGFETTGLVSQFPAYQSRKNELNSKNEELMQLELIQETMEEGTEEYKTIDTQIMTLQNQIQDLNFKQKIFQKEARQLAIMGPLSNVNTATTIGLAVAHAGSQAAHVLLVVNPVTAGAMFVIRGVTSAVGLDSDLKLNEKVSSEFDALDQQRKGMEKGSIVRDIIETKMHQLERQSDDVCASMTRNFVTVISSKLGTAASIGAIVGAKVVLGTVAVGALSASGIGAGVLLGAIGVGATAYAIHKNKELISNTFEEVKIAIETPIQNLRHERRETEKVVAQSKIHEARVFHNKTTIRERKIKAYTNDIMSEINNLVSAKNKIAQQINALEPEEGASIFDRMQASIKIYSKENDIQKINETLEQRKEHLRGIWDDEEKMKSKFQRQEMHATKEVDSKSKESEEIAKRKSHLASESKRLAEEEHYINLALHMNDMTWQDVQKFHKNMEQRFENEPSSKASVKEFLSSQHYSLDRFDTDPASVVLEYVSKEMTV